MKKNNLQKIVFSLLVLTSLASYIYLNTVDVSMNNPSPEMKAELDEEAQEEHDMLLPDVQMVKRILEKSRMILPAS